MKEIVFNVIISLTWPHSPTCVVGGNATFSHTQLTRTIKYDSHITEFSTKKLYEPVFKVSKFKSGDP